MILQEYLFSEQDTDVFRAALMLAMTRDLKEEKELMGFLVSSGFQCAATMLSGNDLDALRRITGNVIGAALNVGVIEKKRSHIHPLGHAIEEAARGSRLDSSVGQNCRLKVGVVRKQDRISVVIYGNIGFHECSSHTTVGGGFQILGE